MKQLWILVTASVAIASCQHGGVTSGSAPLAARSTCPSRAAGAAEVTDTVRAFFAALSRDDDAAVRRLTTADFYAFDVGKRFTGPELSKLVADAHAAGRIFQWNIGIVDARVDCDFAFAAWENQGAAGTAAKLEPRSWLESAHLVRQGERWVIAFLHSTPKDPRK